MKNLLLCLSVLFLSACSIQGMVEKTVPEDVQADHMAHIDRLLDRDTSRIERAFDLDVSDSGVQSQLDAVLANVPDGDEIRRDYVGMNSATSFNTGEGKSRDINLVTEVQTQGGFMTVTTLYALDAQGECCALTNINVVAYDSSPVREGLETVKRIAKIVGLVCLAGVAVLFFFLLRGRKRKRAEQ